MRAVLDRLIPAGVRDGAPGAREARVLTYVDRHMLEPQLQKYAKLVHHALLVLDRLAGREADMPFHALGGAEQDELLGRFQVGRVPGRFPAPRFFAMVHSLALEGFFGDPRQGGNHDRVAWRAIGFDPVCPKQAAVGHGPGHP